MKPTDISLRVLNECFEYDPSAPSCLRWKARPIYHFKSMRYAKQFNDRWAGSEAGGIFKVTEKKAGYYFVRFSFKGIRYNTFAHRVIYSITRNVQLTEDDTVDHKDRNSLNNIKKNLRRCTRDQNNHNRVFKKNVAGYTGVTYRRSKFRAAIRINGKQVIIGTFYTAEEASRAYQEASIKYHKKFKPTTTK